MFKHILLPTDGSDASSAAIREALRFARDAGANVTGLYVVAPFHVIAYEAAMLEDTREEYLRDSGQLAKKYLAEIELVGRELGVPCDLVDVTDDHPFEAIIRVATERHCDLIAMASHGRRGVRGLLLGSETQKVLTHSRTPVLVFR